MVKPKKPDIGVWKTVQAKGHSKHQKAKPKPIGEFPAKPQNQRDTKDASWPNESKQPRSSPKRQFHNKNRQWNNFSTSMPFPSYGSLMHMPWGADFNLPYSCALWFHISYMSSLPTYLCPNYIIYKEPAISKPSPTNNGRFDPKNRPVQKKKHMVIKQVYRVKKDGRLNKNSDLTQDKEKPTVEETSASSVAQIVPNGDHTSNNIVEQCSSSAGGQDKSIYIVSDRTGLTGLSDRSDRSEPGKSGGAKSRIKPTF